MFCHNWKWVKESLHLNYVNHFMALQICKYTFDMEIVRVLTFSTVCQQSTKNMVITNRFLNIEKRFNWKMLYLTWTRSRYWWLFMKYFREHLRTIFLSILWITWMNQKNPFLYFVFHALVSVFQIDFITTVLIFNSDRGRYDLLHAPNGMHIFPLLDS